MNLRIALAISVLFLIGCTSTVKKDVSKLNETNVCCTSASDFKYTSLSPNKETTIKLTSKSLSFNFDSGKSYFKPFVLKNTQSKFTLIIKSYFNNTFSIVGGDHTNSFLKPQVLVYDSQFKLLCNLNSAAKYIEPTWTTDGHFLFNYSYSNERAKYLVITANTGNLTYSNARLKESGNYGISYHTTKIDHSPKGKLKVILSNGS